MLILKNKSGVGLPMLFRIQNPRKEVTMNVSIVIDWKFVAALVCGVIGLELVEKISPDSAEKVLTSAVDAYKEYASSENAEVSPCLEDK